MYRVEDLRKNASGCWDFTAYDAIKHVEENENKNKNKKSVRDYMFERLLKSIFKLCDKSGFKICNRIMLQDKKTGKIYK